MPIYSFQCTCGYRFDKTVPRMASTAEMPTTPCERCGKDADRRPTSCSFAFAHTPTGPVPQNTGVSGIDHNVDVTIGRDAEAKWKTIEARNAEKDRAIRAARQNGVGVEKRDQLVPTLEGGYRPITEPERVHANENRAAVDAISKATAAAPKKEG